MSFEILFAWCNQGYIIYHTRDISKKYKITSKYFSIFNGTPPANWFSHIARDFLTYYTWLFIVLWFHCSQFKNDQDLIFTSKTKHRKNSENVRNLCLLFYLKLVPSILLGARETKLRNDDWKQEWLKADTLGCSEKNLFQKISKIFKTSEGIQVSGKRRHHLRVWTTSSPGHVVSLTL